MAKPVDYKVTLHPAHREGGFVTTTVDIFGGTYPEKTITAAGMEDLICQVAQFANDHGEGCSAFVKCLAPRKPPGFKRATSALYFNLQEKPLGTASAI
ncbi:hypothetical protein [Ahrensia sp. 13_GOM-1096m]|uniref:hypothetical protein n=1 Tax=Ahrensia sp. 13_GOM-1096m TaxID=1380380 RepID=UPI00047BFE14|nr:hypothetical protein [Ahrensia sp. 13_GOM-1096m]